MKKLGGSSAGGLLHAAGHPLRGLIVDLEHILWSGLETNTNGEQNS